MIRMAGGEHDEDRDWGRLGDWIVTRRVQMGYPKQRQFVEHSGLSSRILSHLEQGNRTSYEQSTLARLEQALNWAPGSVRAVLAGGDPQPLPDPPPDEALPAAVEDDFAVTALFVAAALDGPTQRRILGLAGQYRRRQHLELVEQVRRWIVEAGGHVEDSDGSTRPG
jgi:transcriptional regulator with XRE-family HTH domain